MWIAVFIGAMIGYQFGRIPGLIIGGFIAYWLANRFLRQGIGRLAEAQAQFLESTFAVMGAVCKADGQVTQDEIRVAEALFDRLHLSAAQRETAKRAFGRGKAPDFDLDGELRKLMQVTRGQHALLQMFLQVQLSAAAADGELHRAEHDMLLRVARGLGLSEQEIRQLEAMLGTATASAGGGGASASDLDRAYQVLGVTPDVDDATLKKAYRRLMSENHPDKLASKGLPESMREMAEQKTQEITHAYDLVKQARERG